MKIMRKKHVPQFSVVSHFPALFCNVTNQFSSSLNIPRQDVLSPSSVSGRKL